MSFSEALDLRDAPEQFRQRFWSKVDVREPDDCWLWLAYRKPSGYGQFTLRKGRFITASRVALALTQRIPENHVACHACDNPPCCNPAHLFSGTQRDNAYDSVRKGRAKRALGTSQASSRLTDQLVSEMRRMPESRGLNGALAQRFGVSDTAIRRARYGVTWRHVVTPPVERVATK